MEHESYCERINRKATLDDFANILRKHGGKVSPAGVGKIACTCPFHDDSRASACVFDNGDVPCYFSCSACGNGGYSYIDMVEKLDGISVSQQVANFIEASGGKKNTPQEADPNIISFLSSRGFRKNTLTLFPKLRLKIRKKKIIAVGEKGEEVFYIDTVAKKGMRYLFAKGAENTALFFHAIDKNKRVFICEGVLDALAFFSIGEQAIALCGTNVSAAVFEEIKVTKESILAFDSDSAGVAAALRLEYELCEARVANRRKIFFTDEKDPCDAFKKGILTAESVEELISDNFMLLAARESRKLKLTPEQMFAKYETPGFGELEKESYICCMNILYTQLGYSDNNFYKLLAKIFFDIAKMAKNHTLFLRLINISVHSYQDYKRMGFASLRDILLSSLFMTESQFTKIVLSKVAKIVDNILPVEQKALSEKEVGLLYINLLSTEDDDNIQNPFSEAITTLKDLVDYVPPPSSVTEISADPKEKETDYYRGSCELFDRYVLVPTFGIMMFFARTGGGKTDMLCSIAASLAKANKNLKITYIALEDGKKDLALRITRATTQDCSLSLDSPLRYDEVAVLNRIGILSIVNSKDDSKFYTPERLILSALESDVNVIIIDYINLLGSNTQDPEAPFSKIFSKIIEASFKKTIIVASQATKAASKDSANLMGIFDAHGSSMPGWAACVAPTFTQIPWGCDENGNSVSALMISVEKVRKQARDMRKSRKIIVKTLMNGDHYTGLVDEKSKLFFQVQEHDGDIAIEETGFSSPCGEKLYKIKKRIGE